MNLTSTIPQALVIVGNDKDGDNTMVTRDTQKHRFEKLTAASNANTHLEWRAEFDSNCHQISATDNV